MAVDGRRLLADELEFSVLGAADDVSTEFILLESTHFSAVGPSTEPCLDCTKCQNTVFVPRTSIEEGQALEGANPRIASAFCICETPSGPVV